MNVHRDSISRRRAPRMASITALTVLALLGGAGTPALAEKTYWGEVDANGKLVATNLTPPPSATTNGAAFYSLVFDRKILAFIASAGRRSPGQVNPVASMVQTAIADPNELNQHQAAVSTYTPTECDPNHPSKQLCVIPIKSGFSFIVVLQD